jgi:hypothetical protein
LQARRSAHLTRHVLVPLERFGPALSETKPPCACNDQPALHVHNQIISLHTQPQTPQVARADQWPACPRQAALAYSRQTERCSIARAGLQKKSNSWLFAGACSTHLPYTPAARICSRHCCCPWLRGRACSAGDGGACSQAGCSHCPGKERHLAKIEVVITGTDRFFSTPLMGMRVFGLTHGGAKNN